jgi:methionyl-tRNA synthetase
MTKFYSLTTTLPYVNADPHVGFALEIVQADCIARWYRQQGYDVIFNTGTDEHGSKIWQKAQEAGKDVKAYVDEYAAKFADLQQALNLSYNRFIRTTDDKHVTAAQEFWRRCDANGDIYKKQYEVKYCVGCELEKTDSELVDGHCPLHPKTEIELIAEENYFFRFSKYQEPLLKLYETQTDFVVPSTRLHEIKSFVAQGLQDFSISRLKSKMPWGIAVPGDDTQVMYVWFDALVNYISTLNWPQDEAGEYAQYWPGTQVAGKDNLRQQAAMWQAMLLSAGLKPSQQIFIHSFLTSGGQKMSKSLGNVINPFDVVREFGTDALRYWILREANPYEDSDITMESFKEAYNAGLANGLGNLVSRVLTMAKNNNVAIPSKREANEEQVARLATSLANFQFQEAMTALWETIAELDRTIAETEPFRLVKTDAAAGGAIISGLLGELRVLADLLVPFLPGTAEKIQTALSGEFVTEVPQLFPRKS